MRPTSEILADALASFEGGKRWTKNVYYKDGSGRSLDSSEAQAYPRVVDKFCSLGAIHVSMMAHKESDYLGPATAYSSFRRVSDRLAKTMGKHVHKFNDAQYDFEPIKDMFCKAIKECIEEEGGSGTQVEGLKEEVQS